MKLGIGGVLTLVFAICKILKLINWSWWLVLTPLIIELAIALFLIIGLLGIVAIGGTYASRHKR